jgi:hypothetical protein
MAGRTGRFMCPKCPLERKISEVNLARIVQDAIAAGVTDLGISTLLASHTPRK